MVIAGVTVVSLGIAAHQISRLLTGATGETSASSAGVSRGTHAPSYDQWNWCESPLNPKLVDADLSLYQLRYEDGNRTKKMRDFEDFNITVLILILI